MATFVALEQSGNLMASKLGRKGDYCDKGNNHKGTKQDHWKTLDNRFAQQRSLDISF
jgi:hypothetical protein